MPYKIGENIGVKNSFVTSRSRLKTFSFHHQNSLKISNDKGGFLILSSDIFAFRNETTNVFMACAIMSDSGTS